MARNCKRCGQSGRESQRFCAECGAALDGFHEAETSLGTGAIKSASPSRPSESRFLPGTVLRDRYRIVGPLGRGGMGEVYRADDLKLGQPVALKFLPEGLEHDADRLARFIGEVKLARQVSHPNVCRVYDVDEFDGQHFISMEFVDGEDLASLLRRIGRLPQDKAVELSRQICAGLAAAHEQGILHRDLKPANVMVDGRGHARIADFGLAGLPEAIQGAEIMTGTPTYMAPEQLEGRAVSIQSDLYALGLVLYELFTGRPVFKASSRAELLRLQQTSNPVSLSTLVEGIDPAAERAILHCLESEPSARPRSALEVAAGLPGGDPIAAALAAGETPSPDLVAAAGRADALDPRKALVLALLGIAMFAAAGYWRGHYSVRHYLPMDKQPIALIDDAREIIARVGYDEPLYRTPKDHGWGYGIWGSRMRSIIREAKSPEDVERIRESPRAIMDFWYRQSPLTLVPRTRGFGSFNGGPVSRNNPPHLLPGEIFVVLDPEGRLNRFRHTPRGYVRDPEIENKLDEALLFELAGLDRGSFTESRPRYHTSQGADARWAFVGPSFVTGDPDAQIRVEVGMNEGRVSLFAILHEDETRSLAAEPQSFSESYGGFTVFQAVLLVIWACCAFLARSNLQKGRVDRRGAVRATGIVVAATLISNILLAHSLHSPRGFSQSFLVLGTVAMYGVSVLLFYLALEPHARRVWPSMLVSWSRWVGSPQGSREPLVGRAILVGVFGGGLIALVHPVVTFGRSLVEGGVPRLEVGWWTPLYGQRFIWGSLAEAVGGALTQGLTYPLLLVIGLLVFRRKPLAIAFTIVIGIVLANPFGGPWTSSAISILLSAIIAGIYAVVLLRFGLVAVFVAVYIDQIAAMANSSDWGEWHAQPAWIALAVVALIAAFGFRAATAGRRFGETTSSPQSMNARHA